jgi:hypothetical protein
VRSAIFRHGTLAEHLKLLNQFITTIRKTIALAGIFKNLKCRLRLENLTRWDSVYLALEMIKKAYDRGAFDSNDNSLRLPVPIEIIIMYLQILKPAYLFSIGCQSASSSIADVIPCLLNMFKIWTLLQERVTTSGKRLCNLLIDEFKKRFKKEIDSNMYQVNDVSS